MITAWQPTPLDSAAPVIAGVELPAFEPAPTKAPALHAFSISAPAGIPADVLAAETAAARAAGYADGWAAGLAEAREATGARLTAEAQASEAFIAQRNALRERAFDALFDAAQTFEHRAAPAAADIEDQIIGAAWAIASALVGQVLADESERGEIAVRRALALAPADEDVTIRVSPADFAVLAGNDAAATNVADMTDMTPIRRERGLRTVTIAADPSLADGDAIATSGATTVDARLSAALARVQEVLAP